LFLVRDFETSVRSSVRVVGPTDITSVPWSLITSLVSYWYVYVHTWYTPLYIYNTKVLPRARTHHVEIYIHTLSLQGQKLRKCSRKKWANVNLSKVLVDNRWQLLHISRDKPSDSRKISSGNCECLSAARNIIASPLSFLSNSFFSKISLRNQLHQRIIHKTLFRCAAENREKNTLLT
jgi:hypothetical protein